MSHSSILGGESAAPRAVGRDIDALGPSDSSDSGSDVQGERTMPTGADDPDELGSLPVDTASDSDAMGTGERGSATGGPDRDGADILPDHLVSDGREIDDALVDANFTGDVAEIAADEDEDEDEEDSGDEGTTGTRDASSEESDSGDVAAKGGRVFRLPADTHEESDER